MSGYYDLTVQGSKWLTSNQRLHHQARNRLTQEWRENARAQVMRMWLPKLKRAHITAYAMFGDGRRRDPGNWYPTAKACVDGMVDAGLLPDDDVTHLIGPDMRAQRVDGNPIAMYFKIKDLSYEEAP